MHSPIKLPFFCLMLACGLMLAIGGPISGRWNWLVSGVIVTVACVPPIWIIVTGRGNPTWMRSPLDPAPYGQTARKRMPPRPLLRFSVLAGAAFFLAGTYLIVAGGGATRVMTGMLAVWFGGGCAVLGGAVLRR